MCCNVLGFAFKVYSIYFIQFWLGISKLDFTVRPCFTNHIKNVWAIMYLPTIARLMVHHQSLAFQPKCWSGRCWNPIGCLDDCEFFKLIVWNHHQQQRWSVECANQLSFAWISILWLHQLQKDLHKIASFYLTNPFDRFHWNLLKM